MKYVSILALLLTLTFYKTSFAQKIELINSGDLIRQATALHDSGQYKKALALYNKISRSDTNYVWSLYERAYTCEADSQYSQGIKYCQEALSLKEQRDYEPDLYNVYGNLLDDSGKSEEAIKVFDKGISKYPAFALLYFNKGIALLILKRDAEAEVWFKKTLMINPYMYSAHYQLGLAALQQGKIIPAFLSFTSYLLVNPEGKYWSKSITYLNKISKSTDDILEYKNNRTIYPDANYQAVEDVVLSKIALDKGYKIKATVDDPISRQIQAVFEKLEFKETDSDFWVQYYLPYFKKIYNDDKFEMFINHVFSKAQVKIIQDYNKKNKKELDAFVSDAALYFDFIRSTRELNFKNRDTVSRTYLFDSGKLIGKGTLANKGKILTGPWNALYAAGNQKCLGFYNKAGQREGNWVYYFFSGQLKAKEHYVNGKLEGQQEYYFDNGNLSSRENYADNQLSGSYITYYYAGARKSIMNFKAGKKDGEEKGFYSNGNLQTVNNYLNGAETGVSCEYFKNGKLKSAEQYSNGKAEGSYKLYHESGGLSVEGQNNKDLGQGEWKYYFEDGKLKEKRNYVNDNEDGPHQEYYENGQLAATYTSKKGKINGEASFYYKDGKVLANYNYDNGAIKSAKYLDASGHLLSSATAIDSLINIVIYNYAGLKKSHIYYNTKGEPAGADTIYYPSGSVNQINHYKNGDLDGNSVTYFLNRHKKSEINYTDGKEDGYYNSFYASGQLETEGWIKNGSYQGEWRTYHENGKLENLSYYRDGDLDGYREEYLASGQKTNEQKYRTGWLEVMTQFDDKGIVMATDTFTKSFVNYTVLYAKGHKMSQGNYVNGDFDGPYKTYFFDGSPESSFFYNKGQLDSTYTGYYYGGSLSVAGHYKNGNKTGLWKFYDEDGKLSYTTEYKNDMMDGEKVNYSLPDGSKDLVSAYKNDQLDGIEKKFDPDGTLAYQIVFEDDNARSYTYNGSDGKLVPYITIANNNGVIKTYFQNGKLSRECGYNGGIKNGLNKIYYGNGKLRSVDSTAYGNTEGLFQEFYEDGKMKSEYRYVNDNINGTCREFDKNGVIKKEIPYVNGIIHGAVKYFNGQGKPTKTLWYNYGKLTAVKNEK